MTRIELVLVGICVLNATIDSSWMPRVFVNKYKNNVKDLIKKLENAIDASMDLCSGTASVWVLIHSASYKIRVENVLDVCKDSRYLEMESVRELILGIIS